MSYTEKDFSSCIFNPVTKDLFGKYPELEKLFPDGNGEEKVMKYIICMYDMNSPIVRRNPDMKLRRREAAFFVGLDDLADDDELFMFSDEEGHFKQIVFRFLITFAFPLVWVEICANEQTFYEYAARMMQPIKTSLLKEKDEMGAIAIKSKLSTDMMDIRQRIAAGYREIFGEDENLKKHAKKRTTAESMASIV